MEVLTIVIKAGWFDKLASGQTKIERRNITPFWTSRLYDKKGKERHYDEVLFINGYNKKSRQLLTEFKGFTIKGDNYYINIGEILIK